MATAIDEIAGIYLYAARAAAPVDRDGSRRLAAAARRIIGDLGLDGTGTASNGYRDTRRPAGFYARSEARR